MQYDVTYTYAGWGKYARRRATALWLEQRFGPMVKAALTRAGHEPIIYPSPIDTRDPQKGIRYSPEGPRYSTGYGTRNVSTPAARQVASTTAWRPNSAPRATACSRSSTVMATASWIQRTPRDRTESRVGLDLFQAHSLPRIRHSVSGRSVPSCTTTTLCGAIGSDRTHWSVHFLSDDLWRWHPSTGGSSIARAASVPYAMPRTFRSARPICLSPGVSKIRRLPINCYCECVSLSLTGPQSVCVAKFGFVDA